METQSNTDTALHAYLPASGPDSRIELFVQSLAPVENYDSQGQLVERLTQLRDSDRLGALEVTVWGNRICTEGALSSLDTGKHIVETIGDFYAFAADEGVNISPFFQIKNVDASMSGQSFKSVVPPSQCAAMYEGETLVGVFPCVIDGVCYSVRDAIEHLEERTEAADEIELSLE